MNMGVGFNPRPSFNMVGMLMTSKFTKKKSVVFIPGALCTKKIFADQIAGITPTFETLIVDNLKSKSISDMAEKLLESAPPLFGLVGISMGGYVALEVMRIAPERVWGAVLISTTAKAETLSQSEERKRWMRKVEIGKHDDLVDEIVNACISSKNTSNTAKINFYEMVKSHSVETLRYQMIASSTRPDFQESLKNIQCPILLIGGSEDADFFKNGIKKINESVKNSEILFLQNCGHLPTIESPKITTQKIKNFLLNIEV